MSVTHVTGPLLLSLGSALLVTASTEMVVAGLLGFRAPRELAVVALANLATNPAVNLLVASAMALTAARSLAHPPVLATLVVLEIAATLAEWRIYHFTLPSQRPRALPVCALANATSLAVGFAVFGLGA